MIDDDRLKPGSVRTFSSTREAQDALVSLAGKDCLGPRIAKTIEDVEALRWLVQTLTEVEKRGQGNAAKARRAAGLIERLMSIAYADHVNVHLLCDRTSTLESDGAKLRETIAHLVGVVEGGKRG